MSGFHYVGLKITILLLIILVPCIIIGGMISLCSFLKDKFSELKDEIRYAKRNRIKKTQKYYGLKNNWVQK